MHNKLFPHLKNDRWARVNLDMQAVEVTANGIPYPVQTPNPLINVVEQMAWINKIHEILNIDHSWGGYGEYRSRMLRGHYHEVIDVPGGHFWHLGIDYNVPVDTKVTLPVDAELVYAKMDPDYYGGWGGKLIFKIQDGYLILGHLDKIVTDLYKYEKGCVVGVVGDWPINGGWFPHLHVQCMKYYDPDVDGYSHWYPEIYNDYPNPIMLLGD